MILRSVRDNGRYQTGFLNVCVCVCKHICLFIATKCYIVDVRKRCPLLCEVLVRNKCLHNTYSGAIFARATCSSIVKLKAMCKNVFTSSCSSWVSLLLLLCYPFFLPIYCANFHFIRCKLYNLQNTAHNFIALACLHDLNTKEIYLCETCFEFAAFMYMWIL